MFVIRSMVIAMKFVISPRPKGINVSPAKAVTTKVVIDVNLATAIPMDDQAFHATLLAFVVVKQDTVEENVTPAKVVTTKVTLEANVLQVMLVILTFLKGITI